MRISLVQFYKTSSASFGSFSLPAASSTMKRSVREVMGNTPLSPPSSKRKVESTTTQKVVSNFFKPAGKKNLEQVSWRTVHGSLLIGKFSGELKDETKGPKRKKIAAFDFDSTLIKTSSGNVFGKSPEDWRWWDASVPKRLRDLYADGYIVTVLSNQSGITLEGPNSKVSKADLKRQNEFKTKFGYVCNQLDIPISIYAATAKDKFRKPCTGMWEEMLEDYDLDVDDGPNLANSFFVGDAAGRLARPKVKADHSNTDRDLAANIGIGFYTPEEYFLSDKPQPFERKFEPLKYRTEAGTGAEASAAFQKANSLDVVLLCGSPGSGKSTLCIDTLVPLGYERVNQDTLKSRDKCLKVAGDHLAAKRSVAVDNTNADPDTRKRWVELAKSHKVPIRCIVLETPEAVCKHNDVVRALNVKLFNPEKRDMLPGLAFTGFKSRFREPAVDEGFQDITRIPFKFKGDDERWRVWGKYWT